MCVAIGKRVAWKWNSKDWPNVYHVLTRFFGSLYISLYNDHNCLCRDLHTKTAWAYSNSIFTATECTSHYLLNQIYCVHCPIEYRYLINTVETTDAHDIYFQRCISTIFGSVINTNLRSFIQLVSSLYLLMIFCNITNSLRGWINFIVWLDKRLLSLAFYEEKLI